MATLSITIQVFNVTQVLQNFDVIKVYRSDTLDVDGNPTAFVEITNPSTRIPMLSSSAFYTYVDTTGLDTSYYATSYFNSTTLLESSLSDPSRGVANPALDILNVDELKQRYLFGINLTDDDGNVFPDAALAFYIESAVAQASQLLDLPIIPEVILDERHDFIMRDYYKYMYLRLDRYPIIGVDSVQLVLPSNVRIYEFPTEWIYPQGFSGQVHIIPGNGNAASIVLGHSSMWLPLVSGITDFLPDVFRVNYRAGFSKNVPANIIDMIGMLAAFGPLNVMGDLVLGAGIASQQISLDSVQTSIASTQSATNAGYGARLVTYGRRLRELTPELRRYWKGVSIGPG